MEFETGGIQVLERENSPDRRLPYKEFKTLTQEELANGEVVVTNMSPMKLWASQDWVDPEKLRRLNPDTTSESENTGVPAYYYDMPVTGQRAMIIADAHHRTLLAQENGEKVNVKIIGPMPEGMVSIPFSKFRRSAGKPF
jgi:hypothetical protein